MTTHEDAVFGFEVLEDGELMAIDVAGERDNEEVAGVNDQAHGGGVYRGRERREIGFAGPCQSAVQVTAVPSVRVSGHNVLGC